MGKLNYEAWKRIGASKVVLNWIECGVSLPFNNGTLPEVKLPNRVEGKIQEAFVMEELNRRVKKGLI